MQQCCQMDGQTEASENADEVERDAQDLLSIISIQELSRQNVNQSTDTKRTQITTIISSLPA